jgi:hypothetical protein
MVEIIIIIIIQLFKKIMSDAFFNFHLQDTISVNKLLF